jgi:hypothetical protein
MNFVMNFGLTTLLGAMAGLSIYLGLPIARLKIQAVAGN